MLNMLLELSDDLIRHIIGYIPSGERVRLLKVCNRLRKLDYRDVIIRCSLKGGLTACISTNGYLYNCNDIYLSSGLNQTEWDFIMNMSIKHADFRDGDHIPIPEINRYPVFIDSRNFVNLRRLELPSFNNMNLGDISHLTELRDINLGNNYTPYLGDISNLDSLQRITISCHYDHNLGDFCTTEQFAKFRNIFQRVSDENIAWKIGENDMKKYEIKIGSNNDRLLISCYVACCMSFMTVFLRFSSPTNSESKLRNMRFLDIEF